VKYLDRHDRQKYVKNNIQNGTNSNTITSYNFLNVFFYQHDGKSFTVSSTCEFRRSNNIWIFSDTLSNIFLICRRRPNTKCLSGERPLERDVCSTQKTASDEVLSSCNQIKVYCDPQSSCEPYEPFDHRVTSRKKSQCSNWYWLFASLLTGLRELLLGN